MKKGDLVQIAGCDLTYRIDAVSKEWGVYLVGYDRGPVEPNRLTVISAAPCNKQERKRDEENTPKKQKNNGEQVFQGQILEFLVWLGIPAFRYNAGMLSDGKGNMIRLAPKGHSDIAGCIPRLNGRALYIEAKIGKNKPTEDQSFFLQRMRNAGAVAFVAWSLDDVERELKAVGGL